MENTKHSNRSRTPLVLIFAIPIVVLLASTALYFMADARLVDLGEANHGTLITPPVQIAGLALTDDSGQDLDYSQPEPRWSYLIFAGSQCDALCERALFVTGQTHKLLGKKMNRVQRFYISTDGAPAPALQQLIEQQHPGLRLAYGDKDTITRMLAKEGLDPLADHVFFLADPMGWVMMYYTLEDGSQITLGALSKDMIKDIKRLIP